MNTSTLPVVFIIVLNWNGWDDTKECLSSLQKLSYSNYQVILVDNGSTDGSVEKIRSEYPTMKVIENRANLGYAEGNNRGISYALSHNADFVMLLNNDTVVAPDFLEALLEVFYEKPEVGFASPKIYYYDQPTKIWFFGGEIDWTTGWAYHKNPNGLDNSGQYQGVVTTPLVSGCCLMARREVFEQVGLLDARFFLIYEDTDWSVRATSLGYDGVVVADSHIWHKVSASFKRDLPSHGTFYFVRNGLLFIQKHSRHPLITSLKFSLLWIVKPSLLQVRHCEKLWFRYSLLRFSGLIAHLFGHYKAAPRYIHYLISQ